MHNLNVDGSQQTAAEPHAHAAQNKELDCTDTSTANQIAIVKAALLECPKSTVELRYDYGIMHPAARVQSLREMGYRIDTVRIASVTPDGIRHHSVAKYVLHNDEVSEVMP